MIIVFNNRLIIGNFKVICHRPIISLYYLEIDNYLINYIKVHF